MAAVWLVFGCCVGAGWVMDAWCLAAVWQLFGWGLDGVVVLFGWCLAAVWLVWQATFFIENGSRARDVLQRRSLEMI